MILFPPSPFDENGFYYFIRTGLTMPAIIMIIFVLEQREV